MRRNNRKHVTTFWLRPWLWLWLRPRPQTLGVGYPSGGLLKSRFRVRNPARAGLRARGTEGGYTPRMGQKPGRTARKRSEAPPNGPRPRPRDLRPGPLRFLANWTCMAPLWDPVEPCYPPSNAPFGPHWARTTSESKMAVSRAGGPETRFSGHFLPCSVPHFW